MVKLYYTPTSCGASSFICAFITGLKFDCEIVDLTTHKTESGIDFYKINPKGNVPTLVLDDGTILNENISCLEYILDLSLKNEIKLGPENCTFERYFLKSIDLNERFSAGASEYEIYFTYVHLYHPISIRPLLWWQNTYNMVFDSNASYDYISKHWYK